MIKRNFLLSKDKKKVKLACKFLEPLDFININQLLLELSKEKDYKYVTIRDMGDALYLYNDRKYTPISRKYFPNVNLFEYKYVLIK